MLVITVIGFLLFADVHPKLTENVIYRKNTSSGSLPA